ncbi:Pycsar system effector family protein [Streptomyces sp. NPDC006512]|uniref:Pycsar system effector family protein n=1 Tax=Streptomyces sp. NPDC006512 TaxID=3154307 RepID=UPI0033BB0F65
MNDTEDDGPANQVATHLLTEVRVEIARADTKASLLVGALGMTAGGLCAQLAAHRWEPASLSASAQILWWSSAVAFALALAALLLSVVPRSLRSAWRGDTPLSYFGNIHSAVQQGRLSEALSHTGRDPGAALRAALAANSQIAVRKHQWIRAGLLAYGSGVVLLPAALLVG